jgi:polyhydroxyalkanoate synthase
MADSKDTPPAGLGIFGEMLKLQAEATKAVFGHFSQMLALAPEASGLSPMPTFTQLQDNADVAEWAQVGQKLQTLWLNFQSSEALSINPPKQLTDPAVWLELVESWYRQMPLASAEQQEAMWQDSMKLWQGVLGKYSGGDAESDPNLPRPSLPREDRRFADPRWREQPVFALIHQTYLLFGEQLSQLAEKAEGLDAGRKEQLRFATRTLIEALSPANFPMTNPLVLEKTLASKGENLVKGMEHLLADLKKGQLTHTDSAAFELGRNIAITPGKVVYETPLFQLIQYTPTTEKVLETPLLIFPPWINRFYILDLNPQKSFVRWAVEQGVSVFIVSWKSADASMADIVWDDYIRAQIEAIDVVRARLDVPAVHTIGYCVSGTTLAATLAILTRRGEADKVKSATFFTAQVDFEGAGELKVFIDQHQLSAVEAVAKDGYLDGRYMAATFNLLRGSDLIWNYVINNYLLGEEYPAFDLLHWNGDTTNLPAKWHNTYLQDLYKDNLLVVPDRLSADGTPIDLTRIAVPCYIQAGREDHIAPPESVWKLTRHLRGDCTFLLAGSGHIAGVVNPPTSKKYGYWTNPDAGDTLAAFIAGAEEHVGSWWGHWLEWLRGQASAEVEAKGARVPGTAGDAVIEDAPGRYVMTR